MSRRILALGLPIAFPVALLLSACGGGSSADTSPSPGADGGPLRVVAGFYPLAYAA